MSQQSIEEPKKTSFPEALEKKQLKEKKTVLLEQIKQLDEKLAAFAPKKKVKEKIVLTDTMKLAQTVGKHINETKKTKEGNLVQKLIPSKKLFRSKCNVIVSYNDVENELIRTDVENVAKQALALLETMPKTKKADNSGTKYDE